MRQVSRYYTPNLSSLRLFLRCEFRRIHGHCVVPRSNGRLGAWVEKQRIEYKKYLRVNDAARREEGGGGRMDDDENKNERRTMMTKTTTTMPKTILTEDRVRKLDDVHFVWDVRERQFERRLGQLRIHRQAAMCRGGGGGNAEGREYARSSMNGSLAVWLSRCERQYKRYLDALECGIVDEAALSGILPENRRLALESVGFCRSMFDEPRAGRVKNRRATWDERYEELEEYKAEVRLFLCPVQASVASTPSNF